MFLVSGVCLYLKFRHSLVDSYSCSHFQTGCHNASFPSYQLFECKSLIMTIIIIKFLYMLFINQWYLSYFLADPDCTTIGNGCFLSESSCKG